MIREDVHVTNHAKIRAIQRFGVKKDGAENWIRQKLAHATFVSDIVGAKGEPSQLYACNSVGIVLNEAGTTVHTVIIPNKLTQFTNKVRKFISSELAKIERNETKELRGIERLRAEIEIESGELRLQLLRARSMPRKMALQARINALQMRLDELPTDEFEVKRNKTRQAKAVASFL